MTTAAWYIIPGRHILIRHLNAWHFPYSLWHLSYIAIGASLAESIDWALLGWALLAFTGGMVWASHYLDLMKGDPLRQRIPQWQLTVGAVLGLSLAIGIGLWQIILGPVSSWLLLAIPIGVLVAAGYNLEWLGFHGDSQFALFWAVFPLLVAYFAQGLDLTILLIPAVILAFLTATVQRVLSTRVRHLRRRVGDYCVINVQEIEPYPHHWNKTYDKAWLLAPDEKALAWLSAAMVVVAVASLIRHI